MAVISLIEPTKSKRTGDVPFKIKGTGFNTANLSDDFTGAVFYSDISANGGSIVDTNKLELIVDSISGSIAGIDTLHAFPRSFDVSIETGYDISTLPSTNGAKIISLRGYNDVSPTTYFEVYLGYSDPSGYFIRTEAAISGTTVYSNTLSMDPSNVDGLRVIRSEDRMTAYILISGQSAEVGSYLGFSTFSTRIKMSASNATIPVSGSFNLFINKYIVQHVVSLVNKPADIISFTDTEINGRTQANEVGAGDIVVGLPDSTFAELLNGFEYTESQKIKRDTKNFDIIISIFNFHIKPSRNELFTSAGSFTWDDNYWINPDKQNKNLFIPSLWDPVTASVPSDFLQSGHGDHDNIKMIDIKKFRSESLESWHARLNHGTYHVRNVPYYLFSSESITLQLGEAQTGDNRSIQNLKFLPKPGVPISASTLSTDVESGLIIDKKRFEKRGKLSGIVQNGIELDSSVSTNIDKTKNEFTVIYNSNNRIINWRIPSLGSAIGLYTFTLPKTPLKQCAVIFSRTDIFSQEKQVSKFYGDTETIYGNILYGEPLSIVGDYAVDFTTGEVQVILDQEYFDLGYVSFTFDYPAKIEFNDDYLSDKGLSIIAPTPSDLSTLDEVGESDGGPFQLFRLDEFPILDFSDSQFLDAEHFNLFLYDESDNTFDTEWARVRRVQDHNPGDKVYQLNPDQGTILFGNDITGKIPQKYKKIIAGYKTSVRIEYEPVSSSNYWIGRDTDLNLSRNSLNSGFLYLSRKELIPDTVSVSFSTNLINALEFAELSATVRDRDGDPIPAIELTFEIVNGAGGLDEETLITDSNGVAKTIFIPSGDIVDMGIFVQLFTPGSGPALLGDPISGVYFDSGIIVNSSIVAEEDIIDDPEDVYLFKVYDDSDPFNVYDNELRRGGSYYVLHEFDTGTGENELIRPIAIGGKVLLFDQSLPQPFSPSQPNYEPNLRGFAIIGKKQIQAKARVQTELITIDSDIATLGVEYSPIQKGEWTLPVPPTVFDSSEIDRATYITINP